MYLKTNEIMKLAKEKHVVVPAFNIPYLPMMKPVVQALKDLNTFALIAVARLEWVKFESKSLEAVFEEYQKVKSDTHTRLHLDHVPVLDEDNILVDYEADISKALSLGYESVMVDGSRLPFSENVYATKKVVTMAHAAGVPVEAELGAVMGHEEGPMPSYAELFASGKGFTDPDDAVRFIGETGVDWLSVAIGNIHGAISEAKKDAKKTEARINIEHLQCISEKTSVPLVLHGGSGIKKEYIIKGIQNGIAKINIGTAIRQPYEKLMDQPVNIRQEAVYKSACNVLREELDTENSIGKLFN